MREVNDHEIEFRALREDMAEIKHGVKNVQATQTLVAERLTRLEERHDAQRAAVERAFSTLADHAHRVQKLEIEGPDARELLERLGRHELTVEKMDGEHKKWRYVALGVAMAVSLLWTGVGALVVNEVRKASESLDSIPQMVAKQKRQEAINRIILKRLGADLDLVEP